MLLYNSIKWLNDSFLAHMILTGHEFDSMYG